ncbi:MAG: Sir2 silent information regulator family NAD-dependent deacetylase [Eggerthellaceae bacterium]|nr:Sir2 silent information regulator family NAD-dependent deacetylase [Eggerthellaceae bacterium]
MFPLASAPEGPSRAEAERSIERARVALAAADRVLIGAGAGLSAAAGLTYSGERFRQNFPAFIKRYGMTDMYSAGFYPFTTEEDRWAYWAHHATVNNLAREALPLYRELYDWARERDYFVITTNADGQFEKAGFSPDRVFAPQGDYAHLQCSTGRHGVVGAAEALAAIERDTGGGARTRVTDAALVPRCEVCGAPMAMHLRVDGTFCEDDAWHAAEERYRSFVAGVAQHPTLLLELGVGWNTPVWIRFPFERIAALTGSTLVRMSLDDAAVDPALSSAIAVEGDIARTFPLVAGPAQG